MTKWSLAVFVVSAAVVSSAIVVQRGSIASLSENEHASGFIQGDMPTYVCYARGGRKDTLGVTYQNPHDLRPEEEAAHLVNLPIALVGWMVDMGLTGVEIENALRALGGLCMLLLLAKLVETCVGRRRWFWLSYLAIGAGGGFGWMVAMWQGYASGLSIEGIDALASGMFLVERDVYWWFVDLYRNLWYPLELIYHCLIFAQLLALMREKWAVSNFFLALACASNPFVGIQACGVQVGVFIVASTRPHRPSRVALSSAVAIIAAFLAFYTLYLPTDPVAESLTHQHRGALNRVLEVDVMVWAYGPALLGFAVVGLFVLARGWRSHWVVVPAMALCLVTLVLSQNARFLEPGLMPLHFTRGYLHTSLWLIVMWAVSRASNRLPILRLPAMAVVSVALVLALVGTGLFLRQEYVRGPARPNLVWDDAHDVVLVALSKEPSLTIIADDYVLGTQICSLMDHRSAFGTPLTTPHYAIRSRELQHYGEGGDAPLWMAWGEAIIAPRGSPLESRLRADPAWAPWIRSSRWAMFRRP